MTDGLAARLRTHARLWSFMKGLHQIPRPQLLGALARATPRRPFRGPLSPAWPPAQAGHLWACSAALKRSWRIVPS